MTVILRNPGQKRHVLLWQTSDIPHQGPHLRDDLLPQSLLIPGIVLQREGTLVGQAEAKESTWFRLLQYFLGETFHL